MNKLTTWSDRSFVILSTLGSVIAVIAACGLALQVNMGTAPITKDQYGLNLDLGVTAAMFTLGFAFVVIRITTEKPSHKELQDEIKQLRDTVEQLRIDFNNENLAHAEKNLSRPPTTRKPRKRRPTS